MTCDPQIGPFVVGSGLGLKTGRLAADIPKKVKKHQAIASVFKKTIDPHTNLEHFSKKLKMGFLRFRLLHL